MGRFFYISVRHGARCAAAGCALLLVCAGSPLAAAFPDKPVHLVVPYPAGGSSDVLARVLSARLAELWGQPVIVENMPGGGSVFGTHTVSKAAPDAHTLLAGNATLAINEALSQKLPYHALRDFAPISLTARQHTALIVQASSPFTTVRQFADAARAKPNLTYGSAGHGAVGHLAGELFKVMTAANITHVAYNGTRQAINELIANHVSCVMIALPAAMPYVKSGRLRVLALADARRAPMLPNVPTLGESVPGYEVESWYGVLAPYGVSVPLVRRMNADLNTVLNKPDFREQLLSLGYEATASTPGDFQSRLASDIERYSRITVAVGIVAR